MEEKRKPVTTAFNLCKFCADKTISGEYILEHPPKKPGRISAAVFLVSVMNLCLHIDGLEISNLGLNHHLTSERDYVSYLLVVGIFMTSITVVVMLFIFCLISWFKYVEEIKHRGKVFQARECLATGTWGKNLKYVQKKKRNLQIDARNIHDETNTKKGCFDPKILP